MPSEARVESVVNIDISAGSLVAGNSCRVLWVLLNIWK